MTPQPPAAGGVALDETWEERLAVAMARLEQQWRRGHFLKPTQDDAPLDIYMSACAPELRIVLDAVERYRDQVAAVRELQAKAAENKSPNFKRVAASFAAMVVEYVEGGITSNQDWKTGLDAIIERRLQRVIPAFVQAHAEKQNAEGS